METGCRGAGDGRPTRGKTAANRLRRTDTFVLLDRPTRLREVAPLYIDLGFGAEPSTTIETYGRLRTSRRDLRVLGVELDRTRVDAALPFAVPGRLDFRVGGFDLALDAGEQAGVVRAMNVLRQYDEDDHAPAVERLLGLLSPGGLLLEGTSSPTGRLLTMNVYERGTDGAVEQRLVLSPNLRRDWAPRELQTVLPKNLIHRAGPGTDLDELFARWEHAWTREATQLVARGVAFERAASALADLGYDIDRRPALLQRGFLVLGSLKKPEISARNPPFRGDPVAG